MRGEREFDIIVYGASGFTSRQLIKELSNKQLKLALAGRNGVKIQKNVKDIPAVKDVPVFEVLLNEIDGLISRTTLLINCAGPYIFTGELIVRACVHNRTHYIDVTGESCFIERIINKYGKAAEEKNVFILNCCGFDSIPADIGVEYMKSRMGCADMHCVSVMSAYNTHVNKTTVDSLLVGLTHLNETRRLRKENERRLGVTNRKRVVPKKLFYNKEIGSYCCVLMGIDASVVRRTQLVMESQKISQACGYEAYYELGGLFYTIIYTFFFLLFYIFSMFRFSRKLIMNNPGIFTAGKARKAPPSEEMLAKSSFKIRFWGKGVTDGRETHCKMEVSGPDPGYVTTGICLSECACLLLEIVEGDRKDLPFNGGVLTPGCVFYRSDLIERLAAKGIRFDFIDG